MKDFIKINDKDDVIILLKDFKKGDVVDNIILLEDVKMGHKVAICDLKKGHHVIKYGNVIGVLTKDVKKGEWIHSHNMKTSLDEKEPTYVYNKNITVSTEKSSLTWDGYLRENGLAGTRNDFYLLPTVGCVNIILEDLKEKFISLHPEIKGSLKVLDHPYGCSQLGDDLNNTARILSSLVHNPNCGGCLIVSLGCENNRLSDFLKLVGEVDSKRVKYYVLQEHDDEISYGLKLMEEIYSVMKNDKRTTLPLSKIRLGLKCGGSDGFSGLTANPLLGLVSDVIGASGGQVALTEVPEMFGAEQALMNRSKDEKTFNKVVNLINNFKNYYARNNQPCYENPSPGNKDGGITTLEEKSNGCILKGGDLIVSDVIDVGERLKENNLTLVNGPGNDLVASTNLAAAGCNIMFFTTGRGTPFSSVIPTIKVGTQHHISEFKKDWIDFDAGKMLDDDMYTVRDELLKFLLDVASGKVHAKAERNDRSLIAIFKTGVTL